MLQEGVHNKFIQLLDIVSRDVVGVDDLVESEGGLVVIIGKVGADLWRQDVIVIVKKRQVFHRT